MTKLQNPGRLVTMLLAACISLFAQDPKTAIEQKLQSEYALTQPTAAEDEIVTAGSVLVLKKNNLMMSSTANANMYQNTYKDGKISQNALGKTDSFFKHAGKLPGMSSLSGSGTGTSGRTYVAGEKMWLTKIDVKDDGVVLNLLTDTINDVRYKAALKFPWQKGSIPPVDQVDKSVAEVFTVQPADNASDNGQQQQQTAAANKQPSTPAPPAATAASAKPADAPPPPIAPPPPPTDAPTQTISLGQTTDQVVAALGQPQKIVKLATKQIYMYKDMKITFKDGKVSDVQ